MYTPRELLIYLAYKNEGDWHKIRRIVCSKEIKAENDIEEVLAKVSDHAITFLDEDYPLALKQIYCPPFVLFYKGDKKILTESSKFLSVVGSRQHPDIAGELTQNIIAELQEGVTIVSGLAIGIDTVAHRAAIANGKKTIAVLGCGVNLCYTVSNRDVYEEIQKNHLVISEYPDFVEPKPENFPFRNRIIAGLCDGLLVSHCRVPSGTVTTVNYALNAGKDIMAIPYTPEPGSTQNSLIKEGAIVVENASDVIDVLLEAKRKKS